MSQITKKAIIESTLRLAATRPINKITVRDIVDDCGITRNTFYYYFHDIYDVLDDALITEASKVGEGNASPEESFFNLAKFVLEHKKVLTNIYNVLGHERTERYLSRRLHGTVMSYIRSEAEGTGADENDLAIIAVFYEEALFGILVRWLRNDMPVDLPDDIRDVFGRIRSIFGGQIRMTIENSVRAHTQDRNI